MRALATFEHGAGALAAVAAERTVIWSPPMTPGPGGAPGAAAASEPVTAPRLEVVDLTLTVGAGAAGLTLLSGLSLTLAHGAS